MSTSAATAAPAAPPRLAFPAMLAGSAALAFGPWMVRLADVPPAASAFWRLALAVVPLLLLARLVAGSTARMAQGLDRRALALIALAGVFFASDLILWHFGIVRTTLANATLLSNAASFLLPLWGFVVLRHRPGRKALLAIGFALAGTLLLVGQSAEVSQQHLFGDLLCLGAAVLYTGYLIVVDGVRGRVAALPLLAISTLAGAVFLLPFALASGNIWPGDWTPLLLLALGSQVIGQGLVVYAVGHLRPLVVGLTLLIQPAISATIGALRFGEIPGPVEIAGAALVVAALVLVRLPDRRR
ncbi:DMT family transporter [Polymorphobacter fuscus]|uniref:EamA family transporter n=1 Tax=Sandarakinorhabdus fusca TaxID=1439888 RepID=A0A7C9GPL7_9SPHN|nr:DMT family transporter [Polymorphobacter fuscus]KAB7647740.1 DMT family transporter [Polymorphobacter fuscus]MQT17036.1 EamA family transporter [Polymorphobacter fuscus]NJC08972.1 drug/metabolite transporter (DMT)-like permease [Polymorphobacter fuscus]